MKFINTAHISEEVGAGVLRFSLLRLLPIISTLVLSAEGAAVVSRFESVYPMSSGNIFVLDLDQNSIGDVRIDVSAAFDVSSDPYFIATPLGPSSIAGYGGITTSLSVGDLVALSALNWVSSPGMLLTGGVYFDALGNVVAEGWGGGGYDSFGNVSLPPGGPTNQIDMFLVALEKGVAWVDLDSSSFSAIAGRIDVRWGYFEGAGDVFAITEVPEPSIAGLLLLGGCAIITQRRKMAHRESAHSQAS